MRLELAIFQLHFPVAQSLKDKRKVLRGLIDSLRSKFNVSVVEVDFQDKWQRAAMAVAWISMSPNGADSYFSEIARVVEDRNDAVLSGVERASY